MRKIYVLNYPGSYLGGKAVVVAADEEKAKDLLLADSWTFPDPSREEINIEKVFPLDKSAVIFKNASNKSI